MDFGRSAVSAAGRWVLPTATGWVDWIWPIRCLGCRRRLEESEERRNWICSRCRVDLPWSEGVSFPIELGENSDPIAGYSVFRYREPVAGWIRAYKYRRAYYLHRPLARFMNFRCPGEWRQNGWDAVIPLPIHWRRLLQRGFHHVRLLAESVGRTEGWPVWDGWLERVVHRPPQVGLEEKERRSNLRGVFRVRPQAVKEIAGRRILLLDDVLTTGSTVREAARTLLTAGATQVAVWTLARAGEPSDDRPDGNF